MIIFNSLTSISARYLILTWQTTKKERMAMWNSSKSTVMIPIPRSLLKREVKKMKTYYDPKTIVPIPCPYKPPRGKVTYHVNPRLFQVVDSKGNRTQPTKQRFSIFALSSASNPSSNKDKSYNKIIGVHKFGMNLPNPSVPTKKIIDSDITPQTPAKRFKTNTFQTKTIVPYPPLKSSFPSPASSIEKE